MTEAPITPDHEKHQVWCVVSGAHRAMDMLWIAGVPTLVLEWMDVRDGEVPAVTVRLDPRHLSPLDPILWQGADLLYALPVERP
jgi:hypothetical protein